RAAKRACFTASSSITASITSPQAAYSATAPDMSDSTNWIRPSVSSIAARSSFPFSTRRESAFAIASRARPTAPTLPSATPPQPARRLVREHLRRLERGIDERRRRHHPVDHPPGERLVGGDLLAQHRHRRRALEADDARQEEGAAAVGDQPDLRERLDERRLR